MWGNKRKSNNSVDTLIAEGTCINGDLTFDGALFIDGEINGNVKCSSDSQSILSIGLHGKINGEINAPVVVIFGNVNGDVHATEKVELKPGSKVVGDLHYKVIEMNAGAEVNGKMIALGEPQKLEHMPEKGGLDEKKPETNKVVNA